MTDFSPAAQAVLDAFLTAPMGHSHVDDDQYGLAAALRAAADQAKNVHPARPSTEWGEGWMEGVQDVVAGFRRIAAELDGGAQ